MLLSDLVRRLDVTRVDGPLEVQVEGVAYDSRQAGPRDVFVAMKGERVDGRRFVPGLEVAAIIADGPVKDARGTVITVPDARLALALAAAEISGNPSDDVPVVGITGTNGKTTISWMLEAIAQAAGTTAGIIGTTGYRVAGKPLPASHTTPEAPVLQGLLRQMVDAGVGLVAMEVSSIGLSMRRVDGTAFQVAVFTNLSRDHLDFHGTMEAYGDAKARLFTELLRASGTAIVCADDPAHHQMATEARTWTYGLESGDLLACDLELGLTGSKARITTPNGTGNLELQLVGEHNVVNALGALGAALALDISLETALRGLSTLAAIPGRLERVSSAEIGPHVFVDYAHTPDALERVITSLRALKPRRILTVFGCGGDRDAGKRPLMGAAASQNSDLCFVTSDNPRSEDPAAIIADIVAGIAGPHEAEPDRRKAIAGALRAAEPGDVVLIAGKGHETTQTIGTRVLPFDDRQVARELLGGGS